jgi:aspartate aminotransferase-like enzyme
LQGILALLWQLGVEKGYDLAIISGTTRQAKLYQHLGFVPFGPLVGSGDAQFQPMYVTLETFEITAREFLRSSPARSFQPSAVNCLPGPVAVRREVRRAFEQAPESHRGNDFKKDFQASRQILCDLVGARKVELLMGSGTLANDIVAGQLSLLDRPGLVLSNGEFGSRLVDQAQRFNLKFEVLEFPDEGPLDLAAVEKKLSAGPAWLWCVHCETSSGVLNDLAALRSLCAVQGTKLCLDCISTVGTMPLDLNGVYLASGSSGKGLRAYPGLAMVFHHHEAAPAAGRLPRYLDLGYCAQQDGIPFTFSSNLLHALHAAIRRPDLEKRFAETGELTTGLRQRLVEHGFALVGNETRTSPAVITVALPPELDSARVGEAMHQAGYLLSYNSGYLRRKNWIQICLMGEYQREKIVPVANALHRVCNRERTTSPAAQAVGG